MKTIFKIYDYGNYRFSHCFGTQNKDRVCSRFWMESIGYDSLKINHSYCFGAIGGPRNSEIGGGDFVSEYWSTRNSVR